MAKTSLIITSTADGKIQQKAVSNVNPDVSSSKLAQFATQLVSLTTNTYQKTDRIHKLNCDSEIFDPTPKPEPTLELSKSSCTVAEITAAAAGSNKYLEAATITTNSDGELYLRFYLTGTSNAIKIPHAVISTVNGTHLLIYDPAEPPILFAPYTIHIGVLPTDNFAGKEVEFTIEA